MDGLEKRVEVNIIETETRRFLNTAIMTQFSFEILLQQRYRVLLRNREGSLFLAEQYITADDSTHLFEFPAHYITIPPPLSIHRLTNIISPMGLDRSVCESVASFIVQFGNRMMRRRRQSRGSSCYYLVKASVVIVDEQVVDEEEYPFMTIIESLFQEEEEEDGEIGRGVSTSVLEKLKKEGFYYMNEEGSGFADGDQICSVCLDEFSREVQLTRLPCDHIFHQPCILQWLENRNSCPLCRFDIN